jgi:hypothetical protein
VEAEMTDDRGLLVGGPRDGLEFSLFGLWRAFPGGLPAPPPEVAVTELDVTPVAIWPDSIREPAFPGMATPPLLIYRLDPDDPRFIYRFDREEP